jgi:hypothetical protein
MIIKTYGISFDDFTICISDISNLLGLKTNDKNRTYFHDFSSGKLNEKKNKDLGIK